VRTRRVDELTAQAADWLGRAEASGYLRKSPNKDQLLETRPDALRLRPGFRALTAEVLFPDDPFAGAP
jgi:hypothetical protein